MNHKLIFAILCMLVLYTGCTTSEEKISKAEAAAFSTSIEKDVQDLKIDFIEKNIIVPAFLRRMYDARKLKPSEGIEISIKQMLSNNQYEKSIYDIMAGEGNFEMVKQYENEGNQHIIYRVNGGKGFSYIDLELAKLKKRIGIADIFLYNSGENLSASMADLMEKFGKHEGTSIEQTLINRLNNINRYLQNTEYELAKKEFDKLPYDIRNTRLYEIRYLEILSNLDQDAYMKQMKKMELKYGSEPSFQLLMIDVHINKGQWDKAINSINQLDSVINKDPYLDYYRGLVMKMKDDSSKAIEYFEKVIKSYPEFAAGYAELIVFYDEQGKKEKARQYYATYKKLPHADKELIKYFNQNYPQLAAQ